ncbi:hypothetical protein [Alteromonas sp. KUL49]|uniref:hypothetical protein n=1 Tax=Alteromonas sp. KUL49 TaxID=2480798 RepID=UPI00102F2100|nr:hypothetical protein [Alteromonas sp. KUL49]TAP34966.1 hypothetical protein EYS00_19130 [Alteromonas sp. KUL49]GEA13510.1 hypothetical protein KUL49_38850 [Alteromonas sp. KUL49]
MADWTNALMFAVALLAFTLGLSSIIMSFMTTETGAKGMQEKIEYGFFGVSGLVVCLMMGYALA